MTTFPRSPRLLKGGLVLLDPVTSAVRRILVLQYNPDSLSRSFQIQATGEGAERSEALRLKGPAVETLKLEAEIDATDQLERPDENPGAVELGLHPTLAALEGLIHPSHQQITGNQRLANSGALEIVPMEAPLALFVWSKSRIVPVRVTELSITEEAFDPNLNPLRAKISLGLRVLSVNDLGFNHPGGNLFLSHLQQKEQLAARLPNGAFGALGIGGIQ